jgi:hypothetical protein
VAPVQTDELVQFGLHQGVIAHRLVQIDGSEQEEDDMGQTSGALCAPLVCPMSSLVL